MLRNIKVIDFFHVNKMYIPSIFDEKNRRKIEAIKFLKHFVNRISEPVKDIKDRNIHLEYVPTQIITEYLRYLFPEEILGIKYPSPYNNEGYNVVLFITNDNIHENRASSSNDKIITLENYYEYKGGSL